MVTVMNLSTGTKFYYELNPLKALLHTFYSEFLKNHNTWTYKSLNKKYAKTVMESKLCWSIGDFAVFKDGREF